VFQVRSSATRAKRPPRMKSKRTFAVWKRPTWRTAANSTSITGLYACTEIITHCLSSLCPRDANMQGGLLCRWCDSADDRRVNIQYTLAHKINNSC